MGGAGVFDSVSILGFSSIFNVEAIFSSSSGMPFWRGEAREECLALYDGRIWRMASPNFFSVWISVVVALRCTIIFCAIFFARAKAPAGMLAVLDAAFFGMTNVCPLAMGLISRTARASGFSSI